MDIDEALEGALDDEGDMFATGAVWIVPEGVRLCSVVEAGEICPVVETGYVVEIFKPEGGESRRACNPSLVRVCSESCEDPGLMPGDAKGLV